MTDEERDQIATIVLWFTKCGNKCPHCGGIDLAEWRQWIAYFRNHEVPEKQIEAFADQLCRCEAMASAMYKLQPVSRNGIRSVLPGSVIR
jgi:hypothetical protein